MTVRVLALESNVTTLESHRLGLTVFQYPSGALTGETGIRPGGAALSSSTPMVATIAPFTAWIQGGGSTQGGYAFMSDANVNITFDSGEAGNARIDRIIARVYDNTYDASGFVQGTVEYLKGQAGGAANSVPTGATLLYELSVPAGASAGGTPVNFDNAIDKRQFTSANGGVLPVTSSSIRDALTNTYDGKLIFRTDRDWIEAHNGTSWKVTNLPKVSSFANLSLITSPSTGDLAVTTDTGNVYQRFNSSWNLVMEGPESPRVGQVVLRARNTSAVSFPGDATDTNVTWQTEDWDIFSFHSTSSNTSRITPNIPGKYTFNGAVVFNQDNSGYRAARWYKNGSVVNGSESRIDAVTGASSAVVARPTTIECNGSSDYVELRGIQNSGGSLSSNTTNTQQSSVEVTYAGP